MRNRKILIILLIAVGIMLTAGAAAMRGRREASPGGAGGKGAGDSRPEEGAENAASSGCLQILSRQTYQARLHKGREEAFSPSDLLWRGLACACDRASSTVYIPCDARAFDLQGKDGGEIFLHEILAGLEPAGSDTAVFFCEDEMMGDPAAAIAEGHPFEACLSSAGATKAFSLVLTGFPAVCIDKTDPEEIVLKEVHVGRILYIPLSRSEGEEEIRCSFHVRGNVSSTLEKRPYKVSLLDRTSGKYKTSLGGLREDDDWILNPLYTDSSRVREMTAYALWDQVTALSDVPQATSRMRYVELFLDDSYQGIYGLMEPVDGKQLALREGDLLYKIDRWDREYPYLDLYEEMEGETEIPTDKGFPCVEIRFPRDWDRTASWLPMQAYHAFSFRTHDPQTLLDAGLQTDMDSVVSMSLYCALTHAMDNTWKNSFLTARRTGDGYTLYRTVWDLNYVFGDAFVYAPEEGYTVFDAGSASAYVPLEDSTYDFEAFLRADPSLYDALCAKWAQWREGGVNAETVCAAARRNMEDLEAGGAMARETDRWPQEKTARESLQEMEEWIRARFAYLDQQFGWSTK
jgi:hypothetical protein